MENINAEIFGLRNQRKLLTDIARELTSLLGNYTDLENELLKTQYKHGLMIALDEIEENHGLYESWLDQLFSIKQQYHHLWAESHSLLQNLSHHFKTEQNLITELKAKIQALTPENISTIKTYKEKKQRSKDRLFRELTNIKKEIDEMEHLIDDLTNMRKYVQGSSNQAFYTKEVKDYNRIIDKIKSEENKLEQFKLVNNSNMIQTTSALLRSLSEEKENIVQKTTLAIDETMQSLEKKVEYRKQFAEKFLKLNSVRILVQGLPGSGKFTLIHSLDRYCALQRKSNYPLVQAPDYFINEFKGLLVWVENEGTDGIILTLPEFEEKFEEYQDKVKVKIEITCATGQMDEQVFRTLVDGMHFDGYIFILKNNTIKSLDQSQTLYSDSTKCLTFDKELPSLVISNIYDESMETNSSQIPNNIKISVKNDISKLQSHFSKLIQKIISTHSKTMELLNLTLSPAK